MSARQSFLRRKWKLIVNVVTLLVLVVFVYVIRGQIAQTFRNLEQVDWRVLLLIVPLFILNYHAQTKMYQRMFALVGHVLRYKFTFRATLELNFVNQVFPSGGVSGISYFGVRMRSAEISATQASFVQILKLLLLFASFEILLVGGLISLAVAGKANDLILLVGGSVTTVVAIGLVAFVMVIGSERRIHATFVAITRAINTVVGWVTRKQTAISTERAERIIKDVHASYKTIESQYKELSGPLFWALVVNITSVASIYVVYIAFGQWVNIGAIIMAYAVANFAGLVSVLPGGAGIYEALMTGVLVAGGVPAALSLPVTVMWRVLSTVLQLPPGYLLYYQAVHSAGKTPLDQPHEVV